MKLKTLEGTSLTGMPHFRWSKTVEEKELKCTFCYYSKTQFHLLKYHIEAEHDVKMQRIMKFSSRQSLIKDCEKYKYECQICENSYTQPTNLKYHIEIAHGGMKNYHTSIDKSKKYDLPISEPNPGSRSKPKSKSTEPNWSYDWQTSNTQIRTWHLFEFWRQFGDRRMN